MEYNKKIIDFELPEDISLVDVIYEILRNNGLDDSRNPKKEEESQAIIIRDAAITIFKKIIPDEKLIEFLQEHLKTSKETAGKIVNDIKQKLIPYAKAIDSGTKTEIADKKEGGEYKKEDFQKELLNKIKVSLPASEPEITEPKPPTPYEKKPQITSVDKNAEKIKTERQPIISGQQAVSDKSFGKVKEESKAQAPPKEIKPDTYREPIE